jgi:hypothetical protein
MKNVKLAALTGLLLIGATSGAFAQSATYFPDQPSKGTDFASSSRGYDYAPTGSTASPRATNAFHNANGRRAHR